VRRKTMMTTTQDKPAHRFRPRHWLVYTACAGILTKGLVIMLFIIDPVTNWLSVALAAALTVLATAAIVVGIAAILVYAIQWLITLVAMWKPPQITS